MRTLNEELSRYKEIMGINEEDDCPMHVSPSGKITNMCPDDDEYETNYGAKSVDVSGEIDEDEAGGETSAPSSPTMSKWETGLTRGKGNPIDSGSKWESGLTRGKGNPVW